MLLRPVSDRHRRRRAERLKDLVLAYLARSIRLALYVDRMMGSSSWILGQRPRKENRAGIYLVGNRVALVMVMFFVHLGSEEQMIGPSDGGVWWCLVVFWD
jgi:hypothetical protein